MIADVLEGRAQWHVETGDCLEVMVTLGDKSVDHVITDPPYSQHTSEAARSSKARAERFIEFDGIEPHQFAYPILRMSRRWVLSFCALEQLGHFRVAAGEAWIRSGVWVRTNSAPQFTGDRPGQGCEALAIMHQKGRKRWNGGGLPAAWRGPTANQPGGNDGGGHPTPKPLWLMLDLVELFTDPGDLVLDPFAGSGTTGVACIRLGRRFIGIEKDPKYAAIARERLAAEANGLSLREARAGQIAMFPAEAK